MKKSGALIVAIALFLFTLNQCLIAQIPDGFTYQAVARDNNGSVVPGEEIEVVVNILQGSEQGQLAYQEIHHVTTEESGYFSMIIGNADEPSTGGYVPYFSGIDWNAGPYFLGIELSTANGMVNMGASRLWSVPYANLSQNIVQPLPSLTIQSDKPMEEGESLLQVNRPEGIPVLTVSDRDVVVHIDTVPGTKGVKGGFAVGGYQLNKKQGENTLPYLSVTPDSVRIYIEEDPRQKGVKGGFAVGGYQLGKGNPFVYMHITSHNEFIGYNAGKKINEGIYNTAIGYHSGAGLQNGNANVFIGHEAGYTNEYGESNTFIGSGSGFNMIGGVDNVIVGRNAGFSNTGGNGNVFIGPYAGYNEFGSNKLYIENSIVDSGEALIYGDFDENSVSINNSLGIGIYPSANNALEVNGDVAKTTDGGWNITSDRRVKTDIQDIEDSFGIISRLRPVKYKYNEAWRSRHPGIADQWRYNFIAQEYAEVFPQSVQPGSESLNGEPVLQMDPAYAQVVAVKAVQELIRENESLRDTQQEQEEEIRQLREELHALREAISSLEK
mgnify:CR=1 FL=1